MVNSFEVCVFGAKNTCNTYYSQLTGKNYDSFNDKLLNERLYSEIKLLTIRQLLNKSTKYVHQ